MPPPLLIVAASEHCPDMLYATRFFAPDPFVFLAKNGRTTIVLNDLEIDRGRKEATVDEVVSFSAVTKRLPKGASSSFSDVIVGFLRDRKVRRAAVPESFPLGIASRLARAGIRLVPRDGLFWPAREFKTETELRSMRRALAVTESGMARAMEVLRAAKITPRGELRWGNQRLTSESLRTEIDSAVLRAGGLPANTIVAGGEQACDPHERGSGPLRANSLIIIDIFPRDAKSGYFGDMTRTVVRGNATDAQRRLWNTVHAGQLMALKSMKPGASGKRIHESVKRFFTREGYPTEIRDGRWTGFFHGTGHGLGLEIHEQPRLGKTVLKAGQVLTVEPGLYYPGIGGARIEDVVTITGAGSRMLSRFPKVLEL